MSSYLVSVTFLLWHCCWSLLSAEGSLASELEDLGLSLDCLDNCVDTLVHSSLLLLL